MLRFLLQDLCSDTKLSLKLSEFLDIDDVNDTVISISAKELAPIIKDDIQGLAYLRLQEELFSL